MSIVDDPRKCEKRCEITNAPPNWQKLGTANYMRIFFASGSRNGLLSATERAVWPEKENGCSGLLGLCIPHFDVMAAVINGDAHRP